MPFCGLNEDQMNQFCDYWEYNIQQNATISASYKRKFYKVMGYLRKYHSKNTHLWSSRDAPQPRNDEKYKLYIFDTNGPESLHRHLNRIVYKGGSNFTVNTTAGFIQTFYQNCDEKLEKLKNGQIKNELHKYFEVKYSIH